MIGQKTVLVYFGLRSDANANIMMLSWKGIGHVTTWNDNYIYIMFALMIDVDRIRTRDRQCKKLQLLQKSSARP